MNNNQGFKAKIRRLSGRYVSELDVILGKPAEDYVTSETLTIQKDGRDIPAHVQIPISDWNPILYVA